MNGCTSATTCGGDFDFRRVEAEPDQVSGVFPARINRVAFVDKLTLGIDGDLRKRTDRAFSKTRNLAIGGPGRPYARSRHYINKPTGNPLEVKYGPNPMYSNLFDTKLVIRSEGKAVSQVEVIDILNRLFREGHRHSVQGVEYTFDVSIPLGFFETHILTRARSVRALTDECNRTTMYVGSTRGPWFLRVYQKTSNVTRVEFVLRRSFLLEAGVREIKNIGNLKNLDLGRMVRFPAICSRAYQDLIRGRFTGKRLDLLRRWPGHWCSRTLLGVLQDLGLEGSRILRVSGEEELLQQMHNRFTW